MPRQLDLNTLFTNEKFSPRHGLEPRDWQWECLEVFMALLDAFLLAATGQFVFTLYAAPGAGKTCGVGFLITHLLNQGLASQVIYVCPNRRIKRQARKALRKYFGIDLISIGKREEEEKGKTVANIRDGVPPKFQGYIITYQGLANHPEIHHEIAGYRKTVVIFDEVHHLGQHPDREWGSKARTAFKDVPFVISLTGTPYASADVPIEFASYKTGKNGKDLVFQADPESGTGFTYSLGRAIHEGVCRKPQFCFFQGTVDIRPPDGPVITASFEDKVSEKLAADRLRGAVSWPSPLRNSMLSQALAETKKEHRKVAIFLGGDSSAETTAKIDATVHLPDEIEQLGYSRDDMAIFTSMDPKAQLKMDQFDDSSKCIAISISMMSEGSDMPSISAIVLLTTVTSLQTTIQRIGRGLRTIGEPGADPYKTCLVFAFADPELVAMARDLEDEIEIERAIHEERQQRKEGERTAHRRTEAIGTGEAEMKIVVFGDREWPAAKFNQMRAWLAKQKLPDSFLDTALKLMMAEEEQRGNGIQR